MGRIAGVGIVRNAIAVAVLGLLGAAAACGGAPHTPPLVLVSFDGFRWDYAARAETPVLDRLAQSGVVAERLIPVFPSKTFPGHYSVATGLYPGRHGIISNTMRDDRWPERFSPADRSEVQNGRWWGGEPIWVTAARHGLRTGVSFWPGSEAPVAGVRPDWWSEYDAGVPWETRVDAALGWLALPEGERAAFVALYFEEPNDAGHRYGPDAPETTTAIGRADAILGRLVDALAARGIDANVLVVSDHGMTPIDRSRLIVLDDYVVLDPEEVHETGAVGQIFPRSGREDEIFVALERAHAELSVYRRGSIPERLGLFDHPRVPPILLVPAAGWQVATRREIDARENRLNAGDHGYDSSSPDMHGIFHAAGPGLARGAKLGAVEQVDLYALMCRLLGLEAAPNDGAWHRVAGALR